jgi:hypothetical protein
MKVLIMENQLVSTVQGMVDNTIDEFVKDCDNIDAENGPPYLSFDGCDLLDSLEELEIIEVTKSNQNKGKYLLFIAKVNVYYRNVFEYQDYSDFLHSLRLRIQEKYKITVMFTVVDEVNNQPREW